MLLQLKTAINFRSEEEREAIRKVAEKQGIDTQHLGKSIHKGRAYICPANYHNQHREHIEIWDDPDQHCSADDSDPFKWTYLEATDVLRNILIAERKKNANNL